MSLIRADPEEMEKTKMEKRVFLIVLDSFGIGAEPDASCRSMPSGHTSAH